jgi:hypothetical protein
MGTFNTAESKKLYERALKVIPGGASTASEPPLEGHKPYPIVLQLRNSSSTRLLSKRCVA